MTKWSLTWQGIESTTTGLPHTHFSDKIIEVSLNEESCSSDFPGQCSSLNENTPSEPFLVQGTSTGSISAGDSAQEVLLTTAVKYFHQTICRGLAVALFAVAAFSLALVDDTYAIPNGPKTFDLYIRNYFEPGDEVILAKFDALGLEPDSAVSYPSVIPSIRSINPSSKILSYIPINGTYSNANNLPSTSMWRKMWELATARGAWLLDTQGNHIFDHPGKWTINLTTSCTFTQTISIGSSGEDVLADPHLATSTCPSSETSKLDWYVDFILNDILQNGSGPWDGVILDDVWIAISFINPGPSSTLNQYPIDYNQDGIADAPATLDPLWLNGNNYITWEIRRRLKLNPVTRTKILIGNGANQLYQQMNGAYIETFPYNGAPDPAPNPLGYSWNDKMFGTLGYTNNNTNYSGKPTKINVINTKWNQGSRLAPTRTPAFEQKKRFTLVSAMLRDGYYSIDWLPPVGGHNSIWWEPEFDKLIGAPSGAAYQVTYGGVSLWRRDFSNGSVVLNPNYTTFTGSTSAGIPPIGWLDAIILLSSPNEFWASESTPPPAISDLSAVRSSNSWIEVGWSNVADNVANGQNVQVEVRYSMSPISAGNWASASVAPGVVPEAPGVSQKLIISGLASSQTYYFGVKTKDLSGNWSAISNVISATTIVSDSVAPSAIQDLAVGSMTSTGALVTWTAQGDDATTGTAATYDLRYGSCAQSYATWAQVVGEPAPTAPGTQQSITLYGMTPGTTYCFGIKTGDEMPNWSALSNTPSAATLPGDTTPPAAISNLTVVGGGSGYVTFSWTAPGDDGNTGVATTYNVKYTPNPPLTAQNFASANHVNGEPGPALAGTTQSMTVSGLGASGYDYDFAIQTCDEAGNCSAISNVVYVVTAAVYVDQSPPAAITNLASTSISPNSVSLSWTASGDDNIFGTASSYDLRRSTSPITPNNFAAATAIAGLPTPAASGQTQAITIGGLQPQTTYYFAIKSLDDHSNASVISNVLSVTTPSINTVNVPSAPTGFQFLGTP